VSGPAGAFGVLAGIAVLIAVWTTGYGLRLARSRPAADPPVSGGRGRPSLERSEAG
jgi:hypothetical protein